MKKPLMLAAVLSALFVLGPVAGWAGHGGGGYGSAGRCSLGQSQCRKGWYSQSSHGCPVMGKFSKKAHFFLGHETELGLTEAQVQSIKALKSAQKKLAVQGLSERMLFEIDMKDQLSESKIDEAKIGALIDQHIASKAKILKESVANYAKLKAVLSDEQMQKAIELWKKKSSVKRSKVSLS